MDPRLARRLAYSSATPVPGIAVANLPARPGVYAIWEEPGRLLYAGLAGVRWTRGNPRPASTLARRLADHLDARRADVLTSYLFERCVAPGLNPADLRALGDGTLGIRDLVRAFLRDSVRVAWAATEDYPAARAAEDAVRAGALGSKPLINPA